MNFTTKTRNSINSAIQKKVKTQLLDAKKRAENLKQEFINEFLKHPVTKEISAGPLSENLSNTLSGRGNLFTFIGFESGEDPTTEILYLIQNIKIQAYGDYLIITMPTAEEIWQSTPMPSWSGGRSWAKGIESGISGLNYYLFLKKSSEASRSEFGLQSQNKVVSSMRYNPTQYMSTMLKKYKTKFSSLLNRNKNLFVSID